MAKTDWRPALSARAHWRAHRLFHPLCGATPDTLLPLLGKGGIAPGRAHVMAIALAMAALRSPFTLAEAALTAWHSAMPPPIFIVGHWRSGTTHLTNLLSRSPAFGILSPMAVGLPAEARGLARAARPFVEQFFPHDRLIDAMPLRSDLPQEDELAMANLCTLSCCHGLYFPSRLFAEFDRGVFLDGVAPAELRRWQRRLRRYLGKMSRDGRPLLIRNPANSARIKLLASMWPDARFIHIHRDPVDVCASSARMFATLLRELALGRVDDPDAQAHKLVHRVYPRLMRAVRDGLGTLPPSRRIDIRFDDLRTQPTRTLRRIHETLGLDGWREAETRFAAAIRDAGDHVPSHADRDAAAWRWLAEHPDIFRSLGYPALSQNPQATRRSLPRSRLR